jgi:carbon storage regulator
MIVFSRKKRERIAIGDLEACHITVAVDEIAPDQVVLAVEAPSHVPILSLEEHALRFELEQGPYPQVPKNFEISIRPLPSEPGSAVAARRKQRISRQKDEKVMIGDFIVVMVVEIRGDKVRLGIEAPCQIAAYRKEVYEQILREREEGRAG